MDLIENEQPSNSSLMASTESFIVLILLIVLSCILTRVSTDNDNQSDLIILGSSLSPIIPPASWSSSSGRFRFGFYPLGESFKVGIWFAGDPVSRTVVWTANRDDPPLTSNATLNLTMNGELLVIYEPGKKKRVANVQSIASSASMLDSGNLVLYDDGHNIIWRSFDYPTDTILGGQTLLSSHELVSNLSETNPSTGLFRLSMQIDGNLVLYPVNEPNASINAYWASNTFGRKLELFLNDSNGMLVIRNANASIVTSLAPFGSSSNNEMSVYRATVDADGVFRLYLHSYDDNIGYTTSIMWFKPETRCKVKGICGFNSYCTYIDQKQICQCLPGFNFVDQDRESLGCVNDFTEEKCIESKEGSRALHYNITLLDHLNWEDVPYHQASMPKEVCSKSCLEDCNCGAALFQSGNCMKHGFPLIHIRRLADSEASVIALVKLFTPQPAALEKKPPPQHEIESKKAWVRTVLVSIGLVTISCAGIAISGFYICRHQVLRNRRLSESGHLGLTEITLSLFSYNDLCKATKNFSEELGRGSFGAVYKGVLSKVNKTVAVKRLEKVVEEGEREFRAEMKAIGRTHHRNLVRLLGYCMENSKRVLVYEYMSNGSLADLLFKPERRPHWEERVRIALDIARGIHYLHEECVNPIIHCDIKPQNILMDDFWTAKISDFGLSKLLMPDQTRTFTGVRGTRGYLAPEWQNNTPISVKADIYSLGVVLLEIVCCRRNLEVNTPNPDEIVLFSWVYKCFVARQLDRLLYEEEVDKNTLEKMVKVGLWCIQDEPALRPSIKYVILMLEGIKEVPIPPPPSSHNVF